MEIAEHIAWLERDGQLMAAAAERAGLGASVPTCPGWHVRDLLRHQGYVHRWAGGFVRDRLVEPVPEPSEAEILAADPPDALLLDWFRAGHAALTDALRAAPADLQCWTFLSAPSPLAFWARRQAHETAIHRVDAEQAAGGAITPSEPAFAVDGIDELIMGFLGRQALRLTDEQRAGRRRRVRVQATDAAAEWRIELTEDGDRAASVRRGSGVAAGSGLAGRDRPDSDRPDSDRPDSDRPDSDRPDSDRPDSDPPDSTLTGPAAGLYLVLWNRAGPGAATDVSEQGDTSVLQRWRDGRRVRWQ